MNRMSINFISNIVSFIINIGITFFLTPYIIKELGMEAFSFISISNNFVSISLIFTIAINSMAARFISIEFHKKNNNELNYVFSSIFFSNIIITLLLSLPLILIIIFLENIFQIPSHLYRDVKLTYIFVFLNIILITLSNVFGVAAFVRNRLDLSALRDIVGNLIRGILIIILFSIFEPKIYYVTLTILIVSAYTFYINVKLTKLLLEDIKISINFFKKSVVNKILKSGIWNSINHTSEVITNQLDVMLGNILLGAYAGGYYAVTKTIPSFLLLFISMITSVFVANLLNLYSTNRYDLFKEKILIAIKILSLLLSLPIGFLVIFGKEFFMIWLKEENVQDIHLISIIALLSLVFSLNGNLLSNVYTITNNLKIPSLFFVCTGLIKFSIIIILVPNFFENLLVIPIISAVITIFTYILFVPLYAANCLNVEKVFFYEPLMKSIICSMNVIVISFIARFFFIPENWFELFLIAIICSCVSLIINFYLVFSKIERENLNSAILKK